MNLTSVPTPLLIKIWENLREGLDKINTTVEKGTFHTVSEKGSPPSQAGQTTLWFAFGVYQELEARGVIFVEEEINAKPKGSRTRR